MPTTSPRWIDDELFASARVLGEIAGRSASQQIAHWARIGRELEASDSISYRDVLAVLAGRRDYDDLAAEEQAIVRAEWAERMDQRRATLNFAERFATEGRTYVELDDDGNVVGRDAG